MNKQINQVLEFHKTFGIYYQETPDYPPILEQVLRIKLTKEECDELCHEMEPTEEYISDNLDKIAKESADLMYILLGNIITYGLQDKFETIFDEVHRSNMSKLDKDGKAVRREDGKVIKSNLYKEANIKSILNQ
jgi:predicted HAD superfamily Cof-like phosphohydrolase